MTPFRRPAARLALAVGAAGLLPAAGPVLADDAAGTNAGVTSAQDATQTQTRTNSALVEPKFCEGGRCEGTDQADTLVGNNATQQVFGFRGDDDIELDAIFTSGSSDSGIGGEGRDCIDGGAGNDLMVGGPGDDNRPCEFTAFVDPQAALTGGPGDDTIVGGPGNDSMNGIFDDDRLFGGPGNDLLRDTSVGDKDRLSAARATTPWTPAPASAATSSTAEPATRTAPVTRSTCSSTVSGSRASEASGQQLWWDLVDKPWLPAVSEATGRPPAMRVAARTRAASARRTPSRRADAHRRPYAQKPIKEHTNG